VTLTRNLQQVAILSREYPPEVYGGAGVAVEYLSKELAKLLDVRVFCFGAERTDALVAAAYRPWEALDSGAPYAAALQTMSVNLLMAGDVGSADVVHTHTWYANFAGHLAKLLHGTPHVATAHSLEPLRPWKREQLGGGYALSCFCERTAYEAADAVVAVSQQMRADVLACYPRVDPDRVVVIHNGVDTSEFSPDHGLEALDRFGLDVERPLVVFAGRVTRQKGIDHLLDAAHKIDPAVQLVLLPSAADTPQIAEEMRAQAARLAEARDGVFWIEQMLPRPELIQLLSHATVFVCPSIYEPFGLVNLEAMACETAVVASAVGGILEVVVDGETGTLVRFAPTTDGHPADPVAFQDNLAQAINDLVADPERAARMGVAGRRRVLDQFAWSAIAARTIELYESLVR
jgi:alpha-maltose-1-phosphate synthase